MESTAYWTDRLSALDGKPSAFVAGGRDSLCLIYSTSPKDSTAGLGYTFKTSSKAWLRCAFPTPPAKLKRDEQDYWEVRANFPGTFSDNLNMMFNIAAPSAKTLWSVEVPTATISQNIKATFARAGKPYTGNWAEVDVSYVNRYKTGKQWRDNKWVDSWNVTVLGKARFYYRFR